MSDKLRDPCRCTFLGRYNDKKNTKNKYSVVDLPLGISSDRITGALDIEFALVEGIKRFQTGLLAKANRGYLYIDEVNLLEDHLVDLLLDVAQSGENVVEREGLSIRHASRFILIGSGNPEEGELRPQLLDRFGLSVEVLTPDTVDERIEVIKEEMTTINTLRICGNLGQRKQKTPEQNPKSQKKPRFNHCGQQNIGTLRTNLYRLG